ncbi:MAG: glutaredoxin family protein [Hydrocarboniphaga effusa]|nr:glutaredoxin family protein [Hydrocarboniphaga effusa]
MYTVDPRSRPCLLLLVRPGCHLCEEFRAGLEAAFPGRFELCEVCVDERSDWRERFGKQIPVLLPDDGQVLCATRFDSLPLSRRYGAQR